MSTNCSSDPSCGSNGMPTQYMFTVSGITNNVCGTCTGLNASIVVSTPGEVIPISPQICGLFQWVNMGLGCGPAMTLDTDFPGPAWSGSIADPLDGGVIPYTGGSGNPMFNQCNYGSSIITVTPVPLPANTDPQSVPCFVPLSAGAAPGSNLGPGPLAWNMFLGTIPPLLPQLADDVTIQTSLGAMGTIYCLFSPILSPPRVGYMPVLAPPLGCPALGGMQWPGMPVWPGIPGFPGIPGLPLPGWPGFGMPGLVANPSISPVPGPGPSSPQNPSPSPGASSGGGGSYSPSGQQMQPPGWTPPLSSAPSLPPLPEPTPPSGAPTLPPLPQPTIGCGPCGCGS